MDAATEKQKACIRKLFIKCGVPKWMFNPLKLWNISKEDADLLINSLRIMKKFDHGDLKDVIWETIQGKNAIQFQIKTVDQLEEESNDPIDERWPDQQIYRDDLYPNEWSHELHQTISGKEVIE